MSPMTSRLGLLFRSSRPDFIETLGTDAGGSLGDGLFRSSRPDFIETTGIAQLAPAWGAIVPVFQAGLH